MRKRKAIVVLIIAVLAIASATFASVFGHWKCPNESGLCGGSCECDGEKQSICGQLCPFKCVNPGEPDYICWSQNGQCMDL